MEAELTAAATPTGRAFAAPPAVSGALAVEWVVDLDPAAEVVARRDSLVLCLAMRPSGRGTRLLDLAAGGTLPDVGVAVVVPRRLLPALVGRAPDRVVAPSPAVEAVRRLAVALLTVDAPLSPVQAKLAGRALGELVVAALLPLSAAAGVAPRRTASLLDRLIAYVDNHLSAPLDTASLCDALACSRSALYRAAAPVGGVAGLVAELRLVAIHRRLADAGDRRPVAALAEAHGFVDPAAFSRSFRRRFGVTAVAVRRQREPGPAR